MTTRPDPSSARDAASFVLRDATLEGLGRQPVLQHLSRQSGLPNQHAGRRDQIASGGPASARGRPRLRCRLRRSPARRLRLGNGPGGTSSRQRAAVRPRPRAINPRELPPDVAPFCGRLAAVRTLDEVLTEVGVPKLVAICGTAGVVRQRSRCTGRTGGGSIPGRAALHQPVRLRRQPARHGRERRGHLPATACCHRARRSRRETASSWPCIAA